jgi:hypothetical protein
VREPPSQWRRRHAQHSIDGSAKTPAAPIERRLTLKDPEWSDRR